jgi:diaminopimelate decarboxylase
VHKGERPQVNPAHVSWLRRCSEAIAAVGTPCYVAAWQPTAVAIEELDTRLEQALPIRSWLSFKTHPLPSLAVEWLRSGRGIEVVSESELITVLQLGCPLNRLLINGVAKHEWLHKYALSGIHVHFDSPLEVDRLLHSALANQWRVGVRCHVPDETDSRDAAFGGQFGMSEPEAVAALRLLRSAGADVHSIHFHRGQADHARRAYQRGLAHVAAVCALADVAPRALDCGGGLPAHDDPRCVDAVADLCAAVKQAPDLFPRLEEIWLENGRYITGQSAALAVRIVDIKEREECRYLICNGGRTNHALAADHHPHDLLPLRERPGTPTLSTVCGPTCMTDDRLGRYRLPADTAVGDVLIWLDAGAYHLPWETRFSHGLCAVAWYGADDRLTVARPREEAAAWAAMWTPSRASLNV